MRSYNNNTAPGASTHISAEAEGLPAFSSAHQFKDVGEGVGEAHGGLGVHGVGAHSFSTFKLVHTQTRTARRGAATHGGREGEGIEDPGRVTGCLKSSRALSSVWHLEGVRRRSRIFGRPVLKNGVSGFHSWPDCIPGILESA